MRSLRVAVVVGIMLAVALPLKVFGYAGEAGSGDGDDPNYVGLSVSTHHLHLTRALAYCAGLPGSLTVRNPINPLMTQSAAALAEIIAINDELTDQGRITATTDIAGAPVWTNVNTEDWTYTLPGPADVGCSEEPDPNMSLKMTYPILSQTGMPDGVEGQFFIPSSGWFTNRFGPWAPFFHFAEQADLTLLNDFARGATQTLSARSSYAFGGPGQNYWTSSCYKPRTETIATGKMKAGTVEAFATYLHQLGDSYSHGYCRRHWNGREQPPWYFHTPQPYPVDGCLFSDHSLEFGCADSARKAELIQAVIDGGVDVFNQLRAYAQTHGFQSSRIASADSNHGWLRRQLERYALSFETSTVPDGGTCRVSFAWALMKACESHASSPSDACLPDVNVADGGKCLVAGHSGCEGGTEFLPLTPACTPPAQSATAP